MPVRTKVHDDLKTKYAQLVKEHDELNEQLIQSIALHQDVIEERNKAGTLLLDCLRWMQAVSVTTKQRGGSALIADREALMERAREKGWLPRQEEEKTEEVTQP